MWLQMAELSSKGRLSDNVRPVLISAIILAGLVLRLNCSYCVEIFAGQN